MTDADTVPTAAPERAVAIVTGASRGLGLTLARFLVARGYAVTIDARGGPELERVAQELQGDGGEVAAIPGDVTDERHRERLVAAAERLGGLDLLVHNASTLGEAPLPPLTTASIAGLRSALERNVVAPLALTQLALPLLERRSGLIVGVSSDAAQGAYERWGVYGASKAALDLMIRTLAAELASRGVGAVSVDPGDMRTTMQQRAFPGEDIGDRPRPEVTVPFWAWLLSQDVGTVSGHRFEAQGDRWLDAPALLV